ncbi:MAG: isoleucine--tRNA ligase [Acidimicrobiales bacterium]
MSDNTQYNSYPQVNQQANYPIIEEEVLGYWDANHIFEETLKARPSENGEFIFYDGPPFANGLPHYGHLLTGFVKDAIPRFWTMRGKRVDRRFGWDCHGLPAEMATEKDLGVSGRVAINDFGVDRFNAHCRSLVQDTTDAWERYVHRQARWVDFENAYRTMDVAYMESVMWAFKRLYDMGLLYESERVLPYCWECETPLSNFETRQDDSYRPRVDPAVTVAFTIHPAGKKEPERPEEPESAGHPQENGYPVEVVAPTDESDPTGKAISSDGALLLQGELKMLVWTTTPWTLPSNLALAVGPDIVYEAYMLEGAEGVPTLIAAARVEAYGDIIGEHHTVASITGEKLAGRSYRPLFDFFSGTSRAFRIITADFVATDEGTGTVHLAPGFGEDDYETCSREGIATICPMDEKGRFTSDVPPYQGLQVFDSNEKIIHDLADMGALARSELYEHSYPHCWRTDTPLVYKAVSSWFVNVTAIKDRLLASNEDIHWVPSHIQHGAFGKWLEGARDWSISRNRFWGSPIPVWKSDDPRYPRLDVYGSLDELEADFGMRPSDLHLPEIDGLTRPNPDDPTGNSTMRRVPDVLDCWFESGSMPFAQVHYPFERAPWFESHFPSDFVVEYVAQTRGWFYTLHVLAVALFDKPAFKACIAHGVILGDDGRKMSKRLSNYPEPEEIFSEFGADAMRWFLLSSPVLKGQDLVVQKQAIADTVRLAINPMWNAWYFLSLYANADGMRGEFSGNATKVLDRYILSKTAELIRHLTTCMEQYDLAAACHAITSFVEILDNWYIRRSRDRFWTARDGSREVEQDKTDAYNTLHTVLAVLAKLSAPLLPLISEHIYMRLTGERSVHLATWPLASDLPYDPALNASMDRVRDICSAAHGIRKANGIRARLPLPTLSVATHDTPALEQYKDIIADELNVKDVVFSTDYTPWAQLKLSTVPSALGPRLGPQTQHVIRAAKEGKWNLVDSGTVEVDGITLNEGEYSLDLVPLNEQSGRALPGNAGVVVLDLTINDELAREGTARDIVRLVQQARRNAGLDISDRIALDLALPGAVLQAVDDNGEYIKEQTQSLEMSVRDSDHPSPHYPDTPQHDTYTESATLPDSGTITIAIRRHPL